MRLDGGHHERAASELLFDFEQSAIAASQAHENLVAFAHEARAP